MDSILIIVIIITLVSHCILVIELSFDRVSELHILVDLEVSMSIESRLFMSGMAYFYFDALVSQITLVHFVFEVSDVSFGLSDFSSHQLGALRSDIGHISIDHLSSASEGLKNPAIDAIIRTDSHIFISRKTLL